MSLALLVATADSEITMPETARIRTICGVWPIVHATGSGRRNVIGGEAVYALRAKGTTEAFKRAAAALSRRLRETSI